MRVLACGGRNFMDKDWLWAELDALHRVEPIDEIIEGEANGADTIAKGWALHNNVPCTGVPAEWDKHGKKAGYIRNSKMLEYKPDMLLAAPGGKGTNMMCDIARKAGVTVKQLEKADANNSDS